MRIVAGKFRSRVLKPPGKLKVRPTSDRLRETLFDVLGSGVAGSIFVDCYAGTGAVGIEALSRGARSVIFIEKYAPACALIRANLAALGVEVAKTRVADGAIEIFAMDARRPLAQLADFQLRADFLFLDPPYAETGRAVELLGEVDLSQIVSPAATVIIEHDAKAKLPASIGVLSNVRLLKQGDSALTFFR
jgi:16S rRNA (guanine966-N2)-methyltransferase